jgi:hypothetical protein
MEIIDKNPTETPKPKHGKKNCRAIRKRRNQNRNKVKYHPDQRHHIKPHKEFFFRKWYIELYIIQCKNFFYVFFPPALVIISCHLWQRCEITSGAPDNNDKKET